MPLRKAGEGSEGGTPGKQPADRLRFGNIKARIWQNVSEGSVLRNDFLKALQGSVRRMTKWDFIWSQ